MESGIAELKKEQTKLESDFSVAVVEDEERVVPYFRLSQLLVPLCRII